MGVIAPVRETHSLDNIVRVDGYHYSCKAFSVVTAQLNLKLENTE
jgi:hypothetical protein